jgi:hypothetical protein
MLGTLCCVAGWALMAVSWGIHCIGRTHNCVVRAADWLFIRAFELGSR